MNIITGFITGVLSTLAMTGWTELLAGSLGRPYHVIGTLGHVLQMRKVDLLRANHRRVAVATHFFIGGLFGILYYLLISTGVIRPDVVDGMLFGVMLGIIAIVVWYISFKVHPSPPPVSLPLYLLMIFTGHIALALSLVVLYAFLIHM